MSIKKLLTAALTLVLVVFVTAACTTADKNKLNGMENEPKNAEEAVAMHEELMARENAILTENTKLWEQVFAAADKGMTLQEDGKNYGDFLLKTIDGIKDQFSADELKLLNEGAEEIKEIEGKLTLKGEAEKIRDIENKLTIIEKKYPDTAQKSSDNDMSMPSDNGSTGNFPSFEGKDLDGNEIKSDELFSGNAVTVVNFWFTTCSPCVDELSELDALNKELSGKGGSLIGINSFTLDGDEAAISEAKAVLKKKDASYRNVYFDSDSEAGKFIENVYAYPTTYVVDRSGSIVGEPIVGAVTGKSQMEKLKSLIDQCIAADMK